MTESLNRELRAELLRRRDADQAFRKRALLAADSSAGDEDWAVDRENAAWLERVLDARGWPGRAVAGEDGAAASWLLAQHATEPPGFQRRCLRLLARAVRVKDAPAWQWAYLLDRVLLTEGRRQVFGTQVTVGNGILQAARLHDPDCVDARRDRVGLPPLDLYLEQMRADHPPERQQ